MNWNYDALKKQADSEFDFVSKILRDLLDKDHKIRILDIGCSDGYNTIQMFKQFDNVEVVGIDISKDAIQKAQEQNDGTIMTFECVNIENDDELKALLSRYGKFDVVYCSHLIQHLKRDIDFIKKVHYFLLKPNGYFVIKTIDDSTKCANKQNDILQFVMEYYQKCVAPFQELRRHTNRYIGSEIPTLLSDFYYNVARYEYTQTTKGLSTDERIRLFDKCFHFRVLDNCLRNRTELDKQYESAIKSIKDLFLQDDYIFSTTTLLFVARNNV